MIRCEIVKKAGRVQRFRIQGHAGFAALGNDIVCAAVSVLATNAINSCEALLKVVPDVTEEDGDLICVLNNPDSDEIQLLFESMVFGLQQMADEYPRHVELKVESLKE
ncbi:ribosomal-processing cysteine protease Prp [Alicyclobacillus sp. SO9]|uniref:ribosomal-processing cysteine protease Prp n=1 Tax=Alicyclobacillus sp. SO9 TaxID=2665646 RepID=UPI0018E852A0|nr:ribosomal-processing cysteine protease Prp [Alicyclobacillus sp. SO9]QQE77000.1 ribosomal-processing cysteine protease Prp [Alicyclobacillus sp. SO9]